MESENRDTTTSVTNDASASLTASNARNARLDVICDNSDAYETLAREYTSPRCERCGELSYSSLPHCAKCHSELWQNVASAEAPQASNRTQRAHKESGCTDYLQHNAQNCPVMNASDSNETRIINGVACKHVAAYVTRSGKRIEAHWRPIRCCRSYKATPIAISQRAVQAISGATPAQAPSVNDLQANVEALQARASKLASETGNGATQSIEQVNERFDNGESLAEALTPQAPPIVAQANVDASLVPNVPEYYPQNGEVNFVEKAINAKNDQGEPEPLNVLLTGPTGCGKTHLAMRVCQNHNREMFTIQGGAGATYERIIAQKDLVSDGNGGTLTKLTKGILPTAMERGAVLYLDEPNAIPSEVLFYLFSAMDDRRTITLESGEVVKAAQGFVVIGAMNEGAGYAGTALLNTAFRQRGVIKDLVYLPAKRETEVLVKRTGVAKEIAEKLVKVATHLRSGVIKTPISTRALLMASKLHVAGIPIHEAIEGAITNQIAAQFANDRKAVSDVVVSHFGLEGSK